jgi:tetratricopeptide (TPR) repeat protein
MEVGMARLWNFVKTAARPVAVCVASCTGRHVARLLRISAACAFVAVSAGVAGAQSGGISFPPPSGALLELLEQDYLSEAERAQIRVSHGLWEEADLDTPARRAAAALIRGDYLDESLSDPAVPVLDRAEGALRRGSAGDAVVLLEGETSLRAKRLLAESLIDLGEFARAKEVLMAAAAVVSGGGVSDGDELAEGVRCALLLTRLAPPREAGVIGHQQMLGHLARARDELDRFSWRAHLTEAWLLYEKDRYQEVAQAIEGALALNPRSAEGLWLWGLVCVDTFDFPRGEAIANKLDELASPSVSPWAACLRAYVRMRQAEGLQAGEQLIAALGAYPDHRTLRTYEAAAAASAYDFDRTEQLLSAFDELAPGSPAALLGVGKALSGARQYEEAAVFLRRASERWPHWCEPLAELGLSEFQAGRNEEAMEALERAAGLDPWNIRVANSLTLLRDLAGFAKVESEHFVVRCKPGGADELVAREMLETLEEIFVRVTGDAPGGIDHVPAWKTVVELYPNHRMFGVRIVGMPQLHTIAAATGPVIAMEAPREGPGHTGAFDWRRVVQHEYTHTVTLSRTRNRLPHWFTEASAVYLEDSPRDYSTLQLLARATDTDTLFDMDTINVMFARPIRPTDRAQAYAQGHAMYEFMIEKFGHKAPLELMDLYAVGVREQPAFERVMGVGRDDFLAQFKEWMRTTLEGVGMLPTQEHPSLPGLLAAEKGAAAGVAPAGAVVLDPEAGGEPQGDPRPPQVTDADIERWLTEHPDNPFVLAAGVRAALGKSGGKATAETVELLERYARARPVDPLPHRALAAYYIDIDPLDGERAVPHLEFIDAREQHSPAIAVELSRRYAAQGDFSRAIVKATRATQIAPYDPILREFAATITLRAKNYGAAERHLTALTVLEPDRPVHQQRLEALSRLRGTQ